MSLPNKGERFLVFVHTNAMKDYLRQMIFNLRGESVARNARIVVETDLNRAIIAMRGVSIDKIFVDHAAEAAVEARSFCKLNHAA